MANINQLPNIITQALTGSNNAQRNQAEADILYLRDINPTVFFMKCANLIEDQNNSTFIRQSSGTVLGRLLSLKNPVNGHYYWDQIHNNSKQSIKKSILSTLISPSPIIMKAGASVISVIASIQLPRSEWQDLIGILSDNASHQNINIKTATITTLGYICSQLNKDHRQISDKTSQFIINIILLAALQDDDSIVQVSLKALSDSIVFLQKIFQNNQYRNQAFAIFVKKFQERRHIRATYQAFFQFVKSCEPYLNEYFKELIDLSLAHIEERNQNTVLNLQLWQIIGSEVIQKNSRENQRIGQHTRANNFLKNASQILLPEIMKCFLILRRQDQEKQQLKQSALKALSTFVQACDKTVVDKITEGVSMLFNSQNPGHRQACALLFSAISEYSDKEYVTNLFANGFDHLFKLVMDQNMLVIKNTLDGFIRLSQVFPQVFLSHRDVRPIIGTLLDFYGSQNLTIRKLATIVLTNITQGLKTHPKPVSDDPQILLTKSVEIFSHNIKNFGDIEKQLNQKIVTIIMNIIMTTSKRDVTIQLLEFMIDKYYQVIQYNIADQNILIEQVLSILHTAILAHKDSVPSLQIMDKVCGLINFHLKKYGVEQEGLSLLGATCTTFNKAFENRSEQYWSYIAHGLQAVSEKATFKNALSTTGDFARVFQTKFNSHATHVMNKLLSYLNSNFDRQLKINIISCMGDLILSMKQYGESYVDNILDICNLCFTAVYQLSADPNEVQYAQQLKEALVQMYGCMVFALNGNKNPNEKLFNHYGNLATFIVRTCDPKVHPTVDYLRNCIYLLFDAACFYQRNERFTSGVRNILGSQQIQSLIGLLRNYDSRVQVRELIDYIESRNLRR